MKKVTPNNNLAQPYLEAYLDHSSISLDLLDTILEDVREQMALDYDGTPMGRTEEFTVEIRDMRYLVVLTLEQDGPERHDVSCWFTVEEYGSEDEDYLAAGQFP